MPCEVNRTVNFGTTKSGLRHVGYCLLNTKGAIVHTRTERGVHEVGEGTGIYAAMICFPDQFRGTVLWDTGQARPSYAAEEYNYYDNNDVMLEQMKYVFNQLGFIRGLQAGRWALKKETAEMTFYDETGENMLVSYAMMDSNGNPSLEEVFDRVVNEINAPEYPPPITDPPPDNPPNYALSPSDTNPKEGDVVNFSVATNRLVNKLYWTLEPVASAASAGDFRLLSAVNNSGIVPLDNGTGTFTLALADDLLTEGDETFIVNLRYGGADGEIVATSTITVKDTSTTPPATPQRNQVIHILPVDGESDLDQLGPVPSTLSDVNIIQVSVGSNFALALDDTGRVYAWGKEEIYGITEVPDEALTNVTKITTGLGFAYVLKTDGTVFGWGDPANNRFDNEDLTGIIDIFSSWYETLFIDSNGKVHRRGNSSGVTYDISSWTQGVTQVAVGRYNAIALQQGVIKVTGLSNHNELVVPQDAQVSPVSIHAAGGTTFYAIQADGTIVGWGKADSQQISKLHDIATSGTYEGVTSTWNTTANGGAFIKVTDPNKLLGRFFATTGYMTGMIDSAGRVNYWGLIPYDFVTPDAEVLDAGGGSNSIVVVVKGS
jgi:hypothetical protein